jgi:tetratricopeptide (TPR) repeat protein
MLRGVIERHKKNWPEASMLLNQSIDIFKSKGKSVLLAEAYYEYGLLSRGINDREGALTKFKEAFRIARDLGLQRQRERFFMIIERIDEREIVKMLIEEIE